jgi:hypothetical protein
MKYIFIFFILLYSCKSNSRAINVWIENNSDLHKNIEISTYVDDSLVDKRFIAKDSISDRISTFKVDLNFSSSKTKKQLKFISSLGGEKTSCFVIENSLNERALAHVNYVERLFKKGDEYNKIILKSDTVYRKAFYCEIMYRPR